MPLLGLKVSFTCFSYHHLKTSKSPASLAALQPSHSPRSTIPPPASQSKTSIEIIHSRLGDEPDLGFSTASATPASQTPTPHPLPRTSTLPEQTTERKCDSTMTTNVDSFTYDTSESISRVRSILAPQTESQLSTEGPSLDRDHAPLSQGPDQTEQDVQYSTSQSTENSLRTPNVYINGLPPHFPDESLYLMTRDFGHVLSVRTFTRCVGEKMSGYGFVLYVFITFFITH